MVILLPIMMHSVGAGGGGGGWGKELPTDGLALPQIDPYHVWHLYQRNEGRFRPLVLVLRKDGSAVGIEYCGARRASVQRAARKIMKPLRRYQAIHVDVATLPQIPGYTWQISDSNLAVWNRARVRLSRNGYDTISADARLSTASVRRVAKRLAAKAAKIENFLKRDFNLPTLEDGTKPKVSWSYAVDMIKVGLGEDFELVSMNRFAVRHAAAKLVRRSAANPKFNKRLYG